METPNEVCYLSAATSPRSICSLEDSLNFYSAPTSPIPEASNIFLGLETEPAMPSRKFDHDFAFGTSLESDEAKEKQEHLHGRSDEESKLIMAYADELFCDGRLVPLDPPPGFRGGQGEPRSPRSVLGRPISRQCLWNDDFDPFVVALETVREGKTSRRARSLSPQRADTCGNHRASLLQNKQTESVSARWASPQNMWEEDMERNPVSKKHRIIMGEPRGVVFARRVRRVKLGQTRINEAVEPLAQRPKELLREKIMRLLFRHPLSGRKESGSDEHMDNNKLKHRNSDSWKRTFLRRMGFQPIGQDQYNKDKRLLPQFSKLALIQCKHRLSLCTGYGEKYE